jgi:alginate O-acetyltransferase complex protein AlgI
MLFCSQEFLLFFLLVFSLYWLVNQARFRVYLLLAASFYFYASWNKWLALLIVGSTVLDYLIAHGLERSQHGAVRKTLLGLSIGFNLGVLAYFKYMNFFLESLFTTLRMMGSEASIPVLQVMLPIGISFYTFEAISYTVDVYSRRIQAEKSLPHFLLFILFFPHLVAGPIVRARDFLPQVARHKKWNWMRMQFGVELFLLGLFKKLAIADRMAAVADPIFAEPGSYATWAVWLGVLAYSLQIYCDFSGYSDMAIGIAHMFGYKLGVNFRMPYLAKNIAEFWHRWHISLSTWLRDYVFISLGGSRGTRWETYRNLMITMTLGGLWHGASWPFVVWGVVHGAMLVGHRLLKDVYERSPAWTQFWATRTGTAVRMATTFLLVSLGWVLFRAPTLAAAGEVYRRLFLPVEGAAVALSLVSIATLFGVAAGAHYLGETGLWNRWSRRLPAEALAVGYAAIALAAAVLAPASGKAFIYFQF